MRNIRITKEFDFEAAHALDGYNGKCKDIHGHSYHLTVTLIGKPLDLISESSCGMVMDFGDLKKIVRDQIINKFDHRLVLRNDSRFKGLEESNSRMRYVDYQPTCENMLLEMVQLVQEKLEDDIQLHSMSLRETANSFAEWFAMDN